MASWTLVPCLVSLRAEFNKLAPVRDKASDGAIGNAAHAKEPSDHNPDETGNTPTKDADHTNEVHAIDVDNDLRTAGWSMDKCLEIIITRHRLGQDDRLQNVIYNRRIWSRTWGWTARAYTGASAHTEHAHFSSRYTTAQESDTRPWGLLTQEGWDVMATKAEIKEALRELLAEDKAPFDGKPGGRIHAAGWADMTRDQKTDYLCEMVMTARAGDKGMSVMDRLDRIETAIAGLAPHPVAK